MENEALPLVSVLIPCYNHERYVAKALNSVLEETYPHLELILINDGSTDNSHDVILSWINTHPDTPITYINSENNGVCATLNKLITMAKGEYYVLLASDDMLCNNGIAERISIFKAHPNKSVIVSDALVINAEDEVIMQSSMSDYNKGLKEKYLSDSSILTETIVNPSISGPVVMVHHSIYKKVGLYPVDLRAEDWYFYQRAASLKAIKFIDKKFSKYRVHASNSSGVGAQYSKKMALTIVKTYYRNLSFFPGLQFKLLAIKEMLKWSARYLIYTSLNKRAC